MRPLSPVKASVFTKLQEDLKQILLHNGAVPVNDVFFHTWDSIAKILFLYGGYGSGKSVYLIDKLLHHCQVDPYFRCFYGRKVYDTIRKSIFQTFVDRINDLNIKDQFDFSIADNSSMIIRCKANGNSFNPFGAENPNQMLSVKDPSHILCEELDQFTLKDAGVLVSRLRTIKAHTQLLGAFNTANVQEDHWLKNLFFGDAETSSRFGNFPMEKVFCNYPDNYFIDQVEYEQTLWISAGFDEKRFEEVSAGAWGTYKPGSPFIFNFDRNKHVVKGLQAIPFLPVILSFDFNVDPITCLVGQCDGLEMVRILDEYRLLNSDIEELCQRIKADYPDKMLLVTGDASGQNRTALKRDLNYYKEIKRILQLSISQFKIPPFNPRIKNTRVLSNALLKNHKNYFFSDRVPYLVLDLEQVEADANGNIDKSKDKHQSHLLDCWRYFNWTFLKNFLNLKLYEQGPDVHSDAAA